MPSVTAIFASLPPFKSLVKRENYLVVIAKNMKFRIILDWYCNINSNSGNAAYG
jgi:hypothetical protein